MSWDNSASHRCVGLMVDSTLVYILSLDDTFLGSSLVSVCLLVWASGRMTYKSPVLCFHPRIEGSKQLCAHVTKGTLASQCSPLCGVQLELRGSFGHGLTQRVQAAMHGWLGVYRRP